MDCECCRISLSARIDGEAEASAPEEVDAHLHRCAACRAWQAEAEALTRSLRVRPVSPTPDLVDSVVAKAPKRPRWRVSPRVALGAVAAAQIALGMSQMFGVVRHMNGSGSSHLFNESTAWNIAIGVGLAWAAFRARAATGVLPMLCGFLLVLTGFSVHDLIVGIVEVQRLVSHGLVVLGIGLLFAVRRQDRDEGDPGSGRMPVEGDSDLPPPELPRTSRIAKRTGQSGPDLRPSAHRPAA